MRKQPNEVRMRLDSKSLCYSNREGRRQINKNADVA